MVAIVRVDVADDAASAPSTPVNLYVFFFGSQTALAPAAIATVVKVGACKASCHATAETDLENFAALGAATVADTSHEVADGYWVERAIVVGAQLCRTACDADVRA